ncbi:MAG TPA: hypothetical protein PKW10_07055, partial [Saprospiraceae bacterium]|nr:hypothetical protein [Saprospiraceae bacterium]
LALFMTSCNKEDAVVNTDLKIVFTLNYDGKPLVFNQNQAYADKFIRMTRFNFFMTNLKLRSGQDSVKLADLSFVDFTLSNVNEGGAKAGLALTVPSIKSGKYTSLEFGVGLPKDLNATKPIDYPSSNPLSDVTYYWTAWGGYIFSKMEGKFDSLATGLFSEAFTFHTGLDDNYKIVKLVSPINIEGSKTENVLNVSLDVKKLFVMNGQQIDLKLVNQAHGPSNEEVIRALAQNYQAAFKLE